MNYLSKVLQVMLIKNVHVQSLWGHVNKNLTVSIGVSVHTENGEVFIIHNYYGVFLNSLSHISHWKPLDNLFLLYRAKHLG